MTKTFSVSAIKDGTVIDHIPAGQALKILEILKVAGNKNTVTVGLNLTSKRNKRKDLIKISDRAFTKREAQEIAVFAPDATINIIKDFKVTKKIDATLPKTITGILACPNPRCITHFEKIDNFFYVTTFKQIIHLSCKYCEKTYLRDEIKGYQG